MRARAPVNYVSRNLLEVLRKKKKEKREKQNNALEKMWGATRRLMLGKREYFIEVQGFVGTKFGGR